MDQTKEVKKEPVVYILMLESNRYYVGHTDNFDEKMDEYFPYDSLGNPIEYCNANDLTWTQIYKPLPKYKMTFKDGTKNLEDNITLAMMLLFGINNVRGGSWAQTDDYKWEPARFTECREYMQTRGKNDGQIDHVIQLYNCFKDNSLLNEIW